MSIPAAQSLTRDSSMSTITNLTCLQLSKYEVEKYWTIWCHTYYKYLIEMQIMRLGNKTIKDRQEK